MEDPGQSKRQKTGVIASTTLFPAERLAPSINRSKPLVLVTHGSMNPVHLGHVAMMVLAKKAFEAQGFTVAKGFIGITRASHIRKKGTEPIEDAERLRLIEIAAEQHSDWLTHCGGEGVKVHSSTKLVGLLKSQCPKNALYALVEGSDVFDRYFPKNKKYNKGAMKAIVTRAGEEEKVRELRSELRSGAEKILILPPDSD